LGDRSLVLLFGIVHLERAALLGALTKHRTFRQRYIKTRAGGIKACAASATRGFGKVGRKTVTTAAGRTPPIGGRPLGSAVRTRCAGQPSQSDSLRQSAGFVVPLTERRRAGWPGSTHSTNLAQTEPGFAQLADRQRFNQQAASY
jgi:hypothetical protein